MMAAMKTPAPANLAVLVATIVASLTVMSPATFAAATQFTDFSPDVTSVMDEEQAALAEATKALNAPGERGDPMGEHQFVMSRSGDCVPSQVTTYGKALAGDPKAKECWLDWTRSRIRTLREATHAAASGNVPVELRIALKTPKRKAFVPTPVDPLSGSNAKIEHAGAKATLTYTDAGGAHHEYAVARPKFAQGIVQGDAGGWMYLAPDHKSGIMFNMGANASVTGKAANPMMLQMMGQ